MLKGNSAIFGGYVSFQGGNSLLIGSSRQFSEVHIEVICISRPCFRTEFEKNTHHRKGWILKIGTKIGNSS